MSARSVKGTLEIEIKTDRFTQPAKKVETTMNKLGTTGKQSFDKIKQSSDSTTRAFTSLGIQAKQSIDKIQKSSDTAKQSVSSLGTTSRQSFAALGGAGSRAGGQIATSMNQATASVRQLNLATQQATVSQGTMVLGIAALGTSVGTTYTGMSNLNKAELSLDKAMQKVEKSTVGLARANDLLSSTQLAVKRFTLSVNKLQKEGKDGTDAYGIAVNNLELQQQKLITAQDDYRVKLADIQIAENDALQVADDLQDTYINMTISLANTGLMSAFLAKTLMPNLSRSFITNRLSIIANSKAMRFLGFDFKKARIILATINPTATGASFGLNRLTFSLRGLRIGIRATMAALGPIGLAMIGIGIAMEIWQSNAFGVQEALAGLWEWLKKIVPVLEGLEILVKSIFPPAAAEEADNLKESTEELTDEFGELSEKVEDTADSLLYELNPALSNIVNEFDSVGNAAKSAGKELDNFKKKRESFLESKAFEDLSRKEQNEALFGKTGIFSKSGMQILGFRGQEFTMGNRTFRSRIYSKPNPVLGGQASQAIREATRNNKLRQNKSGGSITPQFITISNKIKDSNTNKIRKGGILRPGKSIYDLDAVNINTDEYRINTEHKTSGSRASARIRKYNSIYERFFGEKPNYGKYINRGSSLRLGENFAKEAKNAEDQLQKFGVSLDFIARNFKTYAGKRIIYSKFGNPYGQRYSKLPYYKTVTREPTRREAILVALARSNQIEGAYNTILNQDVNFNKILTDIKLSRAQLYAYKQSDDDLIQIKGKLEFYDRIQMEATLV